MDNLYFGKKLQALWEVIKDFLRWAAAGFIGWFIVNGYTWILSFWTHRNITPPSEITLALGITVKYLDYWWHKYNKATKLGRKGESMGLLRF